VSPITNQLPVATPTANPSAISTLLSAPEAGPMVNPSAIPTLPSAPEASPVAKPTVAPAIVPDSVSSGYPTVVPVLDTSNIMPTVSPSTMPILSPTIRPTVNPTIAQIFFCTEPPEATVKPLATLKPSSYQDIKDGDKTNFAKKVKKGSKVKDKRTRAVYKITGIGKNKTAEYTKSTKKNPTNISIPASVKLEGKNYKITSVGKAAFKNNKKLKIVEVGKNVKRIGQQAFFGCIKLKNVSLGKNVTAIGANAFNKCTALTIITIPSKVDKIGMKAFY